MYARHLAITASNPAEYIPSEVHAGIIFIAFELAMLNVLFRDYPDYQNLSILYTPMNAVFCTLLYFFFEELKEDVPMDL